MFATNFSIGTVSTGEQCVDMTPKYAAGQQFPGVAFVHGAGSTADYCLQPEPANQAALTQKVGSRFPAISGDNGGLLTWGNSLSLSRLGLYVQRLANRPDTTNEYALVSASMGGLVSFNFAAQAVKKPRAIVSVIPVINLNDIYLNNRDGYGAGIGAAYGGSYNEAMHGTTNNPYAMRDMDKLKDIPMLLFYGLTDTLCRPEFTEEFAAADPGNRILVPLESGHDYTSYANVDHDMIVQFLEEHLNA